MNDDQARSFVDPPSALRWCQTFFCGDDSGERCSSKNAASEVLWGDQNPGDVVFVPHGWFHCVLNLQSSVAVTQNFINKKNIRQSKKGLEEVGLEEVGQMLVDLFWRRFRDEDD